MSMNNIIEHFDKAGRPAMRLLGVLVCAAIGIGISAAFIGWGFFHSPIPPLPAQDLLIPALPFGYQAWDNWVREQGRIKANQYAIPTPINPHGGPAAP